MAKGIKGSGPIEDIPIRTSMIIKPSIIRKLKIIVAHEATTQTAIVENLLSDYIAKYEKKNGEIKL